MSSKQGPRQAGMRTPANAARCRQQGLSPFSMVAEAVSMSSKQGPRQAGMRTSANAARCRQQGNCHGVAVMEAAQ
jgi:hypothetical protein